MESEGTAHLQGLIKLARNRSQETRRVLLENISDLFISSSGRLTEREHSLMSDILNKLVHEVEMSVRRDLSERLADIEGVPLELVVNLANDEIEVARPILVRSGILRDADLIEIIKRRTQEHILAVASRDALTEEVTNAIVDAGGEDVIEVLLKNLDAVLSRRAMEYVVEESRRVDQFQQPLLSRHDLPADLAHRMFWWVSAALRDYILEHYTMDEIVVDEVIADTTHATLDQMGREARPETAAQKLVLRLAENGDLTDRFLVQAVRQGKISLFIAGLAYLCHLDIETAERTVFDPGGEALAVAWRSMGFGRSDFASVFLLTRKPGGPESTAILTRILELYEKTSEPVARRALRHWQQNSAYVKAITEISQ